MINVTVWNEFIGEKKHDDVKKLYPDGIHEYIAGFLRTDNELNVRTATMDMPENGLPADVLESTDVLIWWAHTGHDKVTDDTARRVLERVLRGMGFIVLHSGHLAKPFKLLMGTACTLQWRDGDFERVWNIAPNHPIAKGIGEYFEIEEEEMYGERFDIPTPDELIFLGWFSGGEVFRSGCCWNRGLGKVFYFQPGHECNPTYHLEPVQKILNNAVHWAAPNIILDELTCPCAIPSAEDKRKK